MSRTNDIGFLLVPGFSDSNLCMMQAVLSLHPLDRPVWIPEQKGPVVGKNGLAILADRDFNDAPALDVVVLADVPRDARQSATFVECRKQSVGAARFVLASSGGVLVLAKADCLDGRRATTQTRYRAALAELGVQTPVSRGAVREGWLCPHGGQPRPFCT